MRDLQPIVAKFLFEAVGFQSVPFLPSWPAGKASAWHRLRGVAQRAGSGSEANVLTCIDLLTALIRPDVHQFEPEFLETGFLRQ